MRAYALVLRLVLSSSLAAQQTPLAATAPVTPSAGHPGTDLDRPGDWDPQTLRKIGGAVRPPALIHQFEPKYPKPINGELRPSTVLVGMIVNTKGRPTDIHILQSGGPAFDKNAMDAVRKYRFSPATENGQPVSVRVNIEVTFQVATGNSCSGRCM